MWRPHYFNAAIGTVLRALGFTLEDVRNRCLGVVLSAEEARVAAIPVFEEALRVDKTVTETDRVLIRTSVLERTEVAELELRSGNATIERVPVDRLVDSTPAIRQEGDTVIIPVVEEIMVIEKRLLLKERDPYPPSGSRAARSATRALALRAGVLGTAVSAGPRQHHSERGLSKP